MKTTFFSSLVHSIFSNSNLLLTSTPVTKDTQWKHILESFVPVFHESLQSQSRELLYAKANLYLKDGRNISAEAKEFLKLSKLNVHNNQLRKIHSRQFTMLAILTKLLSEISQDIPSFTKMIVTDQLDLQNHVTQLIIAKKFFANYVQPVFQTLQLDKRILLLALLLLKFVYYFEVLTNGLIPAINLLKNSNATFNRILQILTPQHIKFWTNGDFTISDFVKKLLVPDLDRGFQETNPSTRIEVQFDQDLLTHLKRICQHVSFSIRDLTENDLIPFMEAIRIRTSDILVQSANLWIGGYVAELLDQLAKIYFKENQFIAYDIKLELAKRFSGLFSLSVDEIRYACNQSSNIFELVRNLYQVILRKLKNLNLENSIDLLITPVKKLKSQPFYILFKEALVNNLQDSTIIQFLIGTQSVVLENYFIQLASYFDDLTNDIAISFSFVENFLQTYFYLCQNANLLGKQLQSDKSNELFTCLLYEGLLPKAIELSAKITELYDWGFLNGMNFSASKIVLRDISEIHLNNGSVNVKTTDHTKLASQPSDFVLSNACSLLQLAGIQPVFSENYSNEIIDELYNSLAAMSPDIPKVNNVDESDIANALSLGQLSFSNVSYEPYNDTLNSAINTTEFSQKRGSITNLDASKNWLTKFLEKLAKILSTINTVLSILNALKSLMKHDGKNPLSDLAKRLESEKPCQDIPGLFGVIKPSLIYHPSLQEAALHYEDQFLRENYFLRLRPVRLSRKGISKMPYFAFNSEPVDNFWSEVLLPALIKSKIFDLLVKYFNGVVCIQPPYTFMLDNVTINMSHSNEFGTSFIQKLTSLLSTTARQWIQLYSSPSEIYKHLQGETGLSKVFNDYFKTLFAGMDKYLPEAIKPQLDQFVNILGNVLTGAKFDAPKVFNTSNSNFNIDATVHLIAEIPEPAVVLYKILIPLAILWALSIPKTLETELKLAGQTPKTEFPQLYYTWPFYWEVELWRGLPAIPNLSNFNGLDDAPTKYTEARGKLLFWYPAMGITNLNMQLSSETTRYRASDIIAVKVSFTLVPLYSTVFGAFDDQSKQTAMLTYGWLLDNLKNMVMPPEADITCKS